MLGFYIPYVWITIFFALCAFSDLYSAKVSNKFITVGFVLSFFIFIAYYPEFHFIKSLQSFSFMFVVGLLLFKFRVLGGGDIKALLVSSVLLTPFQMQQLLIFSICWAGVYALLYFLIAGQLMKLVWSTAGVYRKVFTAHHKIPFTFGIFLGWLSLFSLGVISWKG